MTKTKVYICSAIKNNVLISEKIFSNSLEKAKKTFIEDYQIDNPIIYGPFQEELISAKEVKFSGIIRNAIFNNWKVSAMLLKEPKDYAYLFFDQHIDNQKIDKPKQSYVVKIEELRFT